MLHQDIFARVGGVENSLEDLFHQQHALEHAARRCHQPGGKVSIHKAQNQNNRNVEHENIASLHGHNISAPTNHPTFDPKAKLHVKRGLRRSVRLQLQDPQDQREHPQSPQQPGMDETSPRHYFLLCLPPNVHT